MLLLFMLLEMSLGGEKFETESTLILDIIVKIHLVL
jgi:hypothetical protein